MKITLFPKVAGSLLILCAMAIHISAATGPSKTKLSVSVMNNGEKKQGEVQKAAEKEQAEGKKERIEFAWHAFPDDARFKVLGLYWFDANKPLLWRLPEDRMAVAPQGVAQRAKSPSGGRIYMKCSTSKLGLKVFAKNRGNGKGFDVYINGKFYKSIVSEQPNIETELVLFSDFDKMGKEITIYLPYHQAILVNAVGVDKDAVFQAPKPVFHKAFPIVYYGSSICQGTGASKPGMTYGAIIARELGADFVNLGFGGAGKAEKIVVELVNSIPACCYVFDLGKSYGMQDKNPYETMIRAVRKSHPGVPIVCITPITSALEMYSESYKQRSEHTRDVMNDAAKEVISQDSSNIFLIDGVKLFGYDEHDGLSNDGLHPSDYGYSLIARKLLPVFRQALGL